MGLMCCCSNLQREGQCHELVMSRHYAQERNDGCVEHMCIYTSLHMIDDLSTDILEHVRNYLSTYILIALEIVCLLIFNKRLRTYLTTYIVEHTLDITGPLTSSTYARDLTSTALQAHSEDWPLTYISMNIDPNGNMPPITAITDGSMNLYKTTHTQVTQA